MKSIYRDQKGYTLVEVLVASALLVSVIIPASLLLGRITASPKAKNLIIASQLAQEAMEVTLKGQLYKPDEEIISESNKNWHVIKEITKENNLITITIKVKLENNEKYLISYQTKRILDRNYRPISIL